MSAILDNSTKEKEVGAWLRRNIQNGDKLRFVSAYFSIYGYEAIEEQLQNTSTRFLFGNPINVGNVDPSQGEDKSFSLHNAKLKIDHPLTQKWAAQKCEEWVSKDSTEIRTVKEQNFLHGKMYHLHHNSGKETAISGSSNFTKRGLGDSKNSNLELNLIADKKSTVELKGWFDSLWNDTDRVEDAKEKVLQALRKLGNDQTPEFIYYKTLYHIFEDRLHAVEENEKIFERIAFDQTAIWKKLYPFQKHGVKGAINRLLNLDGCIIADSVGLGKTYTALAVIKYFELRNENVLVLCPKRLRENWTQHQAASARVNNPFEEDKFQYKVLSHTDVGRESGDVGGIDLSQFNWKNYSLIVIDESHNFRNTGRSKNQFSRYRHLLEEVLQKGVKTKVLMLSATPVNNSLTDLRNQINLLSSGNDHHYRESEIEINSVEMVMRYAAQKFNEWQEEYKGEQNPNSAEAKEELLNSLGGEFFRLLEGLTIARSRHHILEYYPDFVEEGSFPKKRQPDNPQVETDNNGELDYEKMASQINEFKLAIYHPADYLRSDSELHKAIDEEKKLSNLTQQTRERSLVAMMQVNFLKRLESSVEAFRITTGKTVDKIGRMLDKIEKYKENDTIDSDLFEPDENDEVDDDLYVFKGKKWKYHLKHIDTAKWKKDLESEKKVLENILETAKTVTPDRDGKLELIKQQITEKISNPTITKEGKKNHKILIFTTFADTAEYLYAQLCEFDGLAGHHIARISGGRGAHSSIGAKNFQEILDRFAPLGRESTYSEKEQIDVLIATDCISEGQNLQDCDLIINYDIHWNPVRIIQRLGRIDRLKSPNKYISMVNFWPPVDLDKLLQLQNRVLTRMELVNVTSTVQDNPILPEERVRKELDYRAEQFKQLRQELIVDAGSYDGGLELSDFTTDDFLADLLAYIDKSGKSLADAPYGLFSLTPTSEFVRNFNMQDYTRQHSGGIIFCFRQKGKSAAGKFYPCSLVHVHSNGCNFDKPVLSIFRGLARDRKNIESDLARAFDAKTSNGKNMENENSKVRIAMKEIHQLERKKEANRVTGGGLFRNRNERPQCADDYDLISWLIIEEK